MCDICGDTTYSAVSVGECASSSPQGEANGLKQDDVIMLPKYFGDSYVNMDSQEFMERKKPWQIRFLFYSRKGRSLVHFYGRGGYRGPYVIIPTHTLCFAASPVSFMRKYEYVTWQDIQLWQESDSSIPKKAGWLIGFK